MNDESSTGEQRGASAPGDAYRPRTCLPEWGVDELPEPKPLRWRNWTAFVGPGIIMMGAQIAGGEWLMGPEVTARYGGSMMWIATLAIFAQVFYNLECGRYALYSGEPIFTAFMRTRPGPLFWSSAFILLSLGAIIPGMAYHAAAVLASFFLDRAPDEADRGFVLGLGYVCLTLSVVPVFFGGKIYNMIQTVMAVKVIVVLVFCGIAGALLVSWGSWASVFGGFFAFGSVPVNDPETGGETVVNAFSYRLEHGVWPIVSMANIAVLGGFAGYAGGGGLGNSLYSNYVRDKGWGMGSRVGAIPSAVGGKEIKLSHLGKVFPVTAENLRRWRGWWRYVLTDQILIWAPGCFVGMALPALLSLEFAPHSSLYDQPERFGWAQAMITADGMRSAPELSSGTRQFLWLAMLFVGFMVLVPSQMSVVEDISRRWTDVIWSSNRRVREGMRPGQVNRIYYTILGVYVLWCISTLYYFGTRSTPKIMTLIIANLGNLAIGLTAIFLLWVNIRYLPKAIRPRLHHRLGLLLCAVFYLGLALLVFLHKQVPMIRELFGGGSAG